MAGSARRKPKSTCRAERSNGKICKQRVTEAGRRCKDHRGQPPITRIVRSAPRRRSAPQTSTRKRAPAKSAPRKGTQPQAPRRSATPRPRPRTARPVSADFKSLSSAQQAKVQRAVTFCHGTLTSGLWATATEQALGYAEDEHMRRFLKGGRTYNCENLASLARDILLGKDALHEGIGWAVDKVMALIGRPHLERLLARHLAAKIPVPTVDDTLITASRGLQMTGIAVCFTEGRDLTRCACFIDVVLTEGRERVKTLIATAAGDWAELHGIPATI